jgi:hypothetical protein
LKYNQTIIVFVVSLVTILRGTLGLVLLCFGAIAIPAFYAISHPLDFLCCCSLSR